MQTRREFLMTSAGACALIGAPLSWSGADSAAAESAALHDSPFLHGDPYTAHADECGLGGSFDEMREHALRFRTPDEFRDRLVLGLEV